MNEKRNTPSNSKHRPSVASVVSSQTASRARPRTAHDVVLQSHIPPRRRRRLSFVHDGDGDGARSPDAVPSRDALDALDAAIDVDVAAARCGR